MFILGIFSTVAAFVAMIHPNSTSQLKKHKQPELIDYWRSPDLIREFSRHAEELHQQNPIRAIPFDQYPYLTDFFKNPYFYRLTISPLLAAFGNTRGHLLIPDGRYTSTMAQVYYAFDNLEEVEKAEVCYICELLIQFFDRLAQEQSKENCFNLARKQYLADQYESYPILMIYCFQQPNRHFHFRQYVKNEQVLRSPPKNSE